MRAIIHQDRDLSLYRSEQQLYQNEVEFDENLYTRITFCRGGSLFAAKSYPAGSLFTRINFCMTCRSGVIGYTVRPNFRSGPIFGPADHIPLGNTVPPPPPPRTQLPRKDGPSKILYIQGIQSGEGGGFNSLTERRFDFDNHW